MFWVARRSAGDTVMGKVERLQQQIQKLSTEEWVELRDWFLKLDWESWDAQHRTGAVAELSMDDSMNALDGVVSRDPSVMGGAAVFDGTRVPVQTLLDHFDAGESVDDFLVGYPSGRRQQVVEFLAIHQADVDAAWSEEIRRRLERLDFGTAKTISFEEAMRRIRIAAGLDEGDDRGHRGDAG